MPHVAHKVTVAKADDATNCVFGWAMVAVRKDGTTVVDHDGDWIEQPELEEAAYDFVLNVTGPASGEDHDPDYTADGFLIESVVFTDDKLDAMGIDQSAVDRGHWVGLWIPDDEAYRRVRDGGRPMLSIEGDALRTEATPAGKFEVAA